MSRVQKYVAYALGEVLLIFLGITLALWFGNWNQERQLRRIETQTLVDIAEDLRANVRHINRNIEQDLSWASACKRFVDALEHAEPWSDELGKELRTCRLWTSPFLRFAAYESLKTRGTDLIRSASLRSEIVNLYEQVYGSLVDDSDKAFWAFHTSVIEPVLNRHAMPVGPDQYVPNDYGSLRESREFRNMLMRKLDLQKLSVGDQRIALDATQSCLHAIEAELAQR